MAALDDGLPGALVAEGEALDNASVPAQLNHHIVHARDPEASARFLAEILDLPAPTRFGPFVVVQAANGVSLDFIGTDDEKYLVPNHYYPRPEVRSGLR